MTLKQLLDEWPRVKEEISPWPWELHAVGDVALLIFEKGGIKSVLDVWTKTGKKDQLFIASAPQNYDLLVQALGEAAWRFKSLKSLLEHLAPILSYTLSASHVSPGEITLGKMFIGNREVIDSWLTKWGFQEEER